jgi:hypothetical protein
MRTKGEPMNEPALLLTAAVILWVLVALGRFLDDNRPRPTFDGWTADQLTLWLRDVWMPPMAEVFGPVFERGFRKKFSEATDETVLE